VAAAQHGVYSWHVAALTGLAQWGRPGRRQRLCVHHSALLLTALVVLLWRRRRRLVVVLVVLRRRWRVCRCTMQLLVLLVRVLVRVLLVRV
jgi:hypothetical protein